MASRHQSISSGVKLSFEKSSPVIISCDIQRTVVVLPDWDAARNRTARYHDLGIVSTVLTRSGFKVQTDRLLMA